MPSMNDKPALDLNKIRARLESAQGPQYWKSLEELAETEEFQAFVEDEFAGRSPDWLNPAHRRSFLKLMGASLAFAGVTACTKQPKEIIVPYVRQPEEFVPGIAAVLRHCDADGRRWNGLAGRPAIWAGPPKSTAIRIIPAAWALPIISSRPPILTMYDPDRGQAVSIRDRSAVGWHFKARWPWRASRRSSRRATDCGS